MELEDLTLVQLFAIWVGIVLIVLFACNYTAYFGAI